MASNGRKGLDRTEPVHDVLTTLFRVRKFAESISDLGSGLGHEGE